MNLPLSGHVHSRSARRKSQANFLGERRLTIARRVQLSYIDYAFNSRNELGAWLDFDGEDWSE